MLNIYINTAWRNLVKNKTHSLINIIGLSVGMAVAIMIALWIWDEVSFDHYIQHYGRIAQIEQNVNNNGEIQTWAATPYPLAAELRKNYSSDFKSVVLSDGVGFHSLTMGNKRLKVSGSYFEPQAPEMFTLRMLRGSRDGLKDPSSILLSSSSAKAIFGNVDPINKVLKIDNQLGVKVTGVYEDFPHNTSFADLGFMAPWDLYFSNTQWIKTAPDPWRPNAFNVYVELKDHADFNTVSAKIRDAKLRMINAELAKKKPALFLQPMQKWHLYSEFKNGVNTGGRIQYVWLFAIIGVFVLLLACINFMNLSTARSEKRAKEVGVRKAIGSLRWQLISQFLTESLLFTTLAFVLSLIMVQYSLSFFNTISGKEMHILWANAWFWLACIAFCGLTTLAAGSYPALFLSAFQPVKVLKGTFKTSKVAATPRKLLVILQFIVSITLIIGTIIVFRQIQYAKDRPIGYSSNGLLSLPVENASIHRHFEAIERKLMASGAVISMAETGAPPTEVWSTSSGFNWKGKDPNMSVDFPTTQVSYSYGQTLDWKFKAGRDFSKSYSTDSTGIIINETAARFMQLSHPIGEVITWDGTPLTVIGVVKDMVVKSPYDPVRPSVYTLTKDAGAVVLLKINPKMGITTALNKIETTLKQYNPSQPFEYQFVDEQYAQKFGNEQRIGKLSILFAGLAIFISCLGLFGMASFMAEQRFKEIGVRKVLGASVFNVWLLLSKDFMLLVIVAILVATPVSYYLMQHWLQGYQYRSSIAWWVFGVAGLGVMVVTLLTVSFQSVSAALANPIRSLKSE